MLRESFFRAGRPNDTQTEAKELINRFSAAITNRRGMARGKLGGSK
jgi:hypothetical protein